MGDIYESNGSIYLKLIWLVCFKLMWLCKHRIWCYNVWFRKCVKLIWPCISGLTQLKLKKLHSWKKYLLIYLNCKYWQILSKKDCHEKILINFYLQKSSWIFWGHSNWPLKDTIYDNFKSHKKAEFCPHFRRYIFGKTTVGEVERIYRPTTVSSFSFKYFPANASQGFEIF